jgi:hypothetical protein
LTICSDQSTTFRISNKRFKGLLVINLFGGWFSWQFICHLSLLNICAINGNTSLYYRISMWAKSCSPTIMITKTQNNCKTKHHAWYSQMSKLVLIIYLSLMYKVTTI